MGKEVSLFIVGIDDLSAGETAAGDCDRCRDLISLNTVVFRRHIRRVRGGTLCMCSRASPAS